MKANFNKTVTVLFIAVSLFFTAAQAQDYNAGYANENASAVAVPINAHSNIASDSYGNIFMADADNNRILMVNTNGIITTFAGTGVLGYWGDGGSATSANLNHPGSVAIDASGNVFIADTKNNRIRMVNADGIITTIAGNGAQGFAGDGEMAVNASLNEPASIAVDAYKNIYISDNYNNRVRMVNGSSGIIYTIAGNGASPYQRDGGAMGVVPAPQPVYTPAPAPVTYQSYYDELAPYGQWINNSQYGNVWVPAAGAGFVPYSSAGHWVYTSYGWTWASDYSWGWAAFHYGRWDYDNYYGWYWVPGNEWAPAWVSWRSGEGCYGWAPLPPGYGNVSVTNSYIIPNERWVFVQNQYICSPDVYRYYVPREQTTIYLNRSTVINRTYYDNETRTTCYSGPQREEVERYSNASVKQVTITQISKPGQTTIDNNTNTLALYRPRIQNPSPSTHATAPAPTHIFTREEVKPVTERPVNAVPKQNALIIQQPAKNEPQHNNNEPVKEQPKQVESNKEPTNIPQPHNNEVREVKPNNEPANMLPQQKEVAKEPTNIPQPHNNEAAPNHTTENKPNNQLVKETTPVKQTQNLDKQVGKDTQGHVIYQDKKGSKYIINEKGAKVAPAKTSGTIEPAKQK